MAWRTHVGGGCPSHQDRSDLKPAPLIFRMCARPMRRLHGQEPARLGGSFHPVRGQQSFAQLGIKARRRCSFAFIATSRAFAAFQHTARGTASGATDLPLIAETGCEHKREVWDRCRTALQPWRAAPDGEFQHLLSGEGGAGWMRVRDESKELRPQGSIQRHGPVRATNPVADPKTSFIS